MLDPAEFIAILKSKQVSFFAGVPDSLLKNLLALASTTLDSAEFQVCANEGSAVALACGYHLATGKIGCVYMQNSGLGNAINPLLSLADPLVFGIPLLLVIGFRGEPGVQDEPQHKKQGAIMERLMLALDIPFELLGTDSDLEATIERCLRFAKERSGPAAILVRKGAFAGENGLPDAPRSSELMTREAAIAMIAQHGGSRTRFVASTGKIARELYEYRHANPGGVGQDFYCVGGMGHASQIALGICLTAPDTPVYCLDGDGAALMHMGHLAAIAAAAPKNLTHFILNNRVHESVGGQPTVNPATNFSLVGAALNYARSLQVDSEESLKSALQAIPSGGGPALVEVIVAAGSREDLARPAETPQQLKSRFMQLFVERLPHGDG
ncbi:MAG: phosphonopyruvate decarboxylase [Candidatus Obscuribacterales bacterium]|nr:phosphonopyruvate decarboxylase [Candidatus Obscuribacterales bacterium]